MIAQGAIVPLDELFVSALYELRGRCVTVSLDAPPRIAFS